MIELCSGAAGGGAPHLRVAARRARISAQPTGSCWNGMSRISFGLTLQSKIVGDNCSLRFG